MFNAINIPYESTMLFNRFKLKEGVSFEDVELAMGQICNVVKNNYGNEEGGFIAGQVFRFSGDISAEGSINPANTQEEHIAIVTYWKSFDQHEQSHADERFNEQFKGLMQYVETAEELAYELLWQGEPEEEVKAS